MLGAHQRGRYALAALLTGSSLTTAFVSAQEPGGPGLVDTAYEISDWSVQPEDLGALIEGWGAPPEETADLPASGEVPPVETPAPEPSAVPMPPVPAQTTEPAGTCSVSELLVPSCGVWWGVYSIRGADLTSSVTDLEQRTGRAFDIVLRYHDFSGRPGPGVFPDESELELGASRMLFFAWESRLFSEKTELRWSDIAAGRHDDVIRAAADRIRDYGKKVFISFDPEMDRRTTGQDIEKGTPAEYVEAARHVHRLFAEAGAANTVWVWTVTGYLGEGNDERMAAMYPGDEYVDWVAYDPYNFYGCKGSAWETFEQSISGTYRWLTDNGLGHKPFMLPEYGTQYDPADPARSTQWYTDIPATLQRYPNIKGMIRWDSDFGCGLRLDNGPGMVDSFAEAGRHPLLDPAR
ncbi:glycoside hydrolase family 26 protein [Planomonospora parontospora]|uniref:glycoside hydrolase family 26 protein n=1 Tax=Planomonospora parontospora TaxID=58119 RepID=UPI00166FCD50|nr:hypothetical protein [Planomonospora parontospora]GGL56991.1 hypothetical protein GCM10014719_68000 [Planomonospora parontospora subsp. antibiotica]GII15147.1 hypothetical protein Ppa05_18730 [Planomonospora parontospora subsp. antibiotica]